MTQLPDSFDAKQEGTAALVYHCVENFTSFLWYRLGAGGMRVPVEAEAEGEGEGEGGRLQFLAHNQTLLIRRLKTEDEGRYVYIASNGTHQVKGRFNLQVDCGCFLALFVVVFSTIFFLTLCCPNGKLFSRVEIQVAPPTESKMLC